MNGTGAGLTTLKDTINFQKYIIKFVCKYYNELKPVFGDRPNVTPWYTNEDDGNNVNADGPTQTGNESSDEELLFSDYNECNNYNSYNGSNEPLSMVENLTTGVEDGRHKNRQINTHHNVNPSVDRHIQNTLVDISNESGQVGIIENSNDIATVDVSLQSDTQSSSVSRSVATMDNTSVNNVGNSACVGKRKGSLSPQQARSIQKNLLKRHKCQINDKKKAPNLQSLVQQEEDDQTFMRESRINKMKFEELK
jgi:hypothetical protein